VIEAITTRRVCLSSIRGTRRNVCPISFLSVGRRAALCASRPGVYPADMKHCIEDQAGKGYAGKVGTRISMSLSAPKAKSTGLRARHAEKRAGAHSTTIQISVTTCSRTIWRDISPEVPAHPEAWGNVPPQIWCAKVQNCALRQPAALPKLDDTVSRIQERLNPGPRAFKGGKQHVIAAIAKAHPKKARFVLWPGREV